MRNDRGGLDDEAEEVIAAWIVEFLDHDRPHHSAMTPAGLLGRLREHGWHLVRLDQEST